jgi:hypothetical protein
LNVCSEEKIDDALEASRQDWAESARAVDAIEEPITIRRQSTRIRSISRQRASDAAVRAEGENRRRERGRARTIHPHGSAERRNVTVDRDEARGPHLVGRTPGSDSDNLNRGLAGAPRGSPRGGHTSSECIP